MLAVGIGAAKNIICFVITVLRRSQRGNTRAHTFLYVFRTLVQRLAKRAHVIEIGEKSYTTKFGSSNEHKLWNNYFTT